MRCVAATCLTAALTLVSSAGATANVSGPDIVSFLNAQRGAHGIPAGIVEDPALSDGCAKHNAYGARNGVLTHGEDPSLPGYTPEGDQAGKTSVLYAGSGPWTAASNPFETAPIHLHQLLAPRIDRMGAGENQDYGCATTLASRNRAAPPADAAYTYPGDGATNWPPAQTASEGPYTPGERVGIPAGTTTGPYLYVMFDGPDLTPFDTASATGASLTGPDGPVDIAVVDNHTSGLQGFLPPGMQLIPRAPLRASSTYTASVAASLTTQGGGGAARPFSRTWSFTTGAQPNRVRVTSWTTSGRTVRVRTSSDAPGTTVEATGPGGTVSRAAAADGSATLELGADGSWRICARSGGGATGYAAAEDCVTVSVSGPATTRPGTTTTPSSPARPDSASPGARRPGATTSTRRPGSGSGSSATGGGATARGPFSLSVPSTVRRGSPIRIRLTSERRFSARITVKAPGGRMLDRGDGRRLRAGTPWTWRLSVPRRYSRRGRTVRVTVVATAGSTKRTFTRRVRFR